MFLSCNSGKLNPITSVDGSLKELSAMETVPNSNLLWSIEDSNNDNIIYGLNRQGSIIKSIKITNAKNRDWEDLTSDNNGNLYIGDFGNNNKKHKRFFIYKISNLSSTNNQTTAEVISFKLPKGMKSKNFEAFFLWEDYFYLFSKDPKKTTVIKVPNRIGLHIAKFVSNYNLKGKHTQITSSDISKNGKKIALLNHDKVIIISNFTFDNIFSGTINYLNFDHDSQKEGICFKNNNTVIITDEYNHLKGGNIYEFNLN